MSDFKFNCWKLFEKFPLYNYRTLDSNNKSKLEVLLIGSGTKMDTIVSETLTNGQLLDTDLHLILARSKPTDGYHSLQKQAPYLDHFVEYIVNDTKRNQVNDEDKLATITFEKTSLSADYAHSLENLLSKYNYANYIIISTGNNDKNYALAKSCVEFLEASPRNHTLLVYVQQTENRIIQSSTESVETYVLTNSKETNYKQQIEDIALNLHYAYSKNTNDRADTRKIIEQFQSHDPYVYPSNIEAALHIRSKLASCDIFDESLDVAAEKFNLLIKQEPNYIEKLSILEHRRWMMEKMLQGYCQLDRNNYNLIYSQPGIATHSSDDKWHCCLVSSYPNSILHAEDWKNIDQNSFLDSLDPLDKVSIDIHKKCGEIANFRSADIKGILNGIQSTLTNHSGFSKSTIDIAYKLGLIIAQMYEQKRTTIPLYERELAALKDAISKEGRFDISMLISQIETLDNAIAPLKEFINFKDYKAADRDFIRKIPFALTHKMTPSLVKLISYKNQDDLFSTWRLEPSSVLFIACVHHHSELNKLLHQFETTHTFLDTSHITCNVSWCIIVSEEMKDAATASKKAFEGDSCKIMVTDAMSLSNITDKITVILNNQPIDYIDITGADPILLHATTSFASVRQLPVFYVKNGQLKNLFNAKELEYEQPAKGLYINEMFHLSDALIEEVESENLSDFAKSYHKLWNIANNASNWNNFCEFILDKYDHIPKIKKTFRLTSPGDSIINSIITVQNDVAPKLIPILKKLKSMQFISDFYNSENQNFCTITLKSNDKSFADSLKNELTHLCNQYTSSLSFEAQFKNKHVTISLEDLYVKNLELHSGKNDKEYLHILKQLNQQQIIINFIEEEPNTYSFRFASQNTLNIFRQSGKILEYYIYYSALLEANCFTDVAMGWSFRHSTFKEDSAKNELDVICTKGTSSLFISAKMRQASSLTKGNTLNYILYEVSLLAEQFGINAKPVLVAPALSYYKYDENDNIMKDKEGKSILSPEAQNASNRGVHLLGKECFGKNVSLGQFLDHIINSDN